MTPSARVRIEKIVYGGSGLARLDGKVLFVPFAASGDDLLVSIEKTRPDYLQGSIRQVIRPGEGRRNPPCPYYQKCGGCQLQHLDYPRQVVEKTRILTETLARELSGEPIPPLEFLSSEESAYRRNARFQVGDCVVPRVGFYRANSRHVVDIDECLLLAPAFGRAYQRLRTSGLLTRYRREEISGIRAVYSPGDSESLFAVLARQRSRDEDLQARGYYRDDGSQIVEMTPGPDEPGVLDRVGEYRYRMHALSFFQSNLHLTPKLVELVLSTAGLGGSRDLAVDLFSGCGLFTLPLASRFGRVVAVEQDARAHGDAVYNAFLNGVEGVQWVHSHVETWIEGWDRRTVPDFLLVDPPREGLGKAVSQWVLDTRPRNVTYVSCNPSTLARDLKRWIKGRDYRIDRIIGLDLFPQTFHIETVVSLRSSS